MAGVPFGDGMGIQGFGEPFASPTPFGTQAGGGVTPSTTIIAPPDDRYLPGYSSVDADGNTKTVGPKLKDLNIPFSLYGLQIPITFGVRRLYGNIIWAIPLRENIKKKKSGGKGGGPKEKTISYQYFATYAISFGTPGITDASQRDIIRIWADGTLIFDRRGTGRTKIAALNYNFYKGLPDQMPDPIIESKEGAGTVPAFRDLMYMVIHDLPVGEFGDRPPAISVEIGDATEQEYITKNIATPVISGQTFQLDGFPSFQRGVYWQALGTNSSNLKTLLQYNMQSGTFIGQYPLNQGDGVGYISNSLTPPPDNLANVTGMNSQCWTYIPWLHKIIATAGGNAGNRPVMLIDPDSGQVTNWAGVSGVLSTSYQFASTFLATTQHMPVTLGFCPFPIVSAFGFATGIILKNLYGGYGILTYDPYNRNNLELCAFKPTSTGHVSAMCPGPNGLNFGIAYVAVGAVIHEVTGEGTPVPGTGAQPGTGFTIDTSWLTAPGPIDNLVYYANDESLIVFYHIGSDNGHVRKYDIASKTMLWQLDFASAADRFSQTTVSQNAWLSDISGGTLAWVSIASARVVQLDLTFGDLEIFNHSAVAFQSFSYPCYHDSLSRSIWGRSVGGDGLPVGEEKLDKATTGLFYDRISDARMSLADFILGMAIYAGYAEADVFIDPAIDDTIDGAMITNITSFRSVINAIMGVYRIDIVESEGKIKFVRKAVGADAVTFNVVENQLLGDPEQPEMATHRLRREEEIAVPERVVIRFIDKTLGYQWSAQTATRSQFISTNGSDNQLAFEIPIIMSATEAKAAAQRVLYTAWNSRVAHQFAVGPEFLRMEPGDVGTVTARGITYTIKTIEISYNADFSLGLKAQNFLSDEAIVVTADTGSGYDPGLPPLVNSELVALDIPLLRGLDDISFTNNNYPMYYYNGPLILTATWGGAVAMISRDFINFTDIGANTTIGFTATCGSVLATPGNPAATDTETELIIYPKSGDQTLLESCTYDEMLTIGANAAAIGRPGRWEIIQFQDVVDNLDGSFTLSTLLRARRGSDVGSALHLPGDLFVLLNADFIDFTALSFADLNKFLDFKAVGFGQFEDDVLPNRVYNEGISAQPWPPVNTKIFRELGGDGTIQISWERRARTEGPLVDVQEVAPLTNYETDEYRVTITRWPYYSNWEYIAGEWQPGTNDPANDTVVFDVVGRELVLDLTEIRTAELYEFSAPDDPFDSGSAFSQVGGDYIAANDTANQIVEDLGFAEFVRFKYLDIMVQQKTSVPNGTGYGPARIMRIPVRDVVALP